MISKALQEGIVESLWSEHKNMAMDNANFEMAEGDFKEANKEHPAEEKDSTKEKGQQHDTVEKEALQSADPGDVDLEEPEKPGILSPEDVKREKFKILKNMIVISFGFLFLFTAFQSLQNLQSSLNPDQGLGLASLSVIYAALIMSCMFVPPYLIGRLGCKWTLFLAMVGYLLYTLANYHARWWTLIPASILIGASAAPLWSAKCAYLTTTGIRYSEINHENQDAVVTRFFGIFFLIFQSGQIWGNLISSLVLDKGGPEYFRADAGDVCGVNFISDIKKSNATNATDTLATPEYSLVIKLLSIYLGCGVFAMVVVICLLDRLWGNLSRKKDSVSGWNLVLATLKHLKDRRMQLVLPITFYSGIEQAFIFGDFTKAFVTCSLGIHKVGFIMICFGVTDAAFSLILGKLTQYTGRIAIFLSGMIVHLTTIIIMLAWSPSGDLVWVFYVLAALQGYCDAVWQTQINALYGVYFSDNQEPAFSNYRLWESLGFVVAYAYSNSLRVRVKLIILLIVLVVGIIMYLASEFVHRVGVKEHSITTEEGEGNALQPLKITNYTKPDSS